MVVRNSKCRIDGWMENIGKSLQTKCIASVGRKIVVQLFGFCLCPFVRNGER